MDEYRPPRLATRGERLTLTSVEPQARYGGRRVGGEGGAVLGEGGCWVIGLGCPPGWGHLAPVSLAVLRLPSPAGAPLGGPSSRRPFILCFARTAPFRALVAVLAARPTRRADARLAPGRLLPLSTLAGWLPSGRLPPHCPVAGVPRDTCGGSCGSCPGPLGSPVAARPVRGARYLREPRRYWRGKGPGAGRMLPARGLKTSPNFRPCG